MKKKELIALADRVRTYNNGAFDIHTTRNCVSPIQFTHTQLLALADFCESTNSNFNRQRWFDYIAGKCGPNGGVLR